MEEQQHTADESIDLSQCDLCGQQRRLTFHHLIPRTVHGNKWFKKRFSREDMQRGIYICRTCHSYLHKHFAEKELARRFNTKEALLENDFVQRRIIWVRRRDVCLPIYSDSHRDLPSS